MADDKRDQPQRGDAPKPGDVKPPTQFGAGVQADADKAGADASKPAEVTPKQGGQGADVPSGSETIPGGAYIVGDKVLDAEGRELKGYKVGKDDDGNQKIVKS